jgi:hypothetical protein
MSKGFLVFAQNTDSVDYVQQAYALALSIHNSQEEITNISLVTNSVVPDNYKSIFDQIIPIPYFKNVVDSPIQAEHRYQLYSATPYDETIVLDADMLVLEDLSDWWTFCKDYNIKFCSKVRNYKQEIITVDPFHRKSFIANKLSNPYFALHYFKKSEQAEIFYKILEYVVNNWELCCGQFAPKEYQKWISMDLATAIAIDILDMQDIVDPINPLEFVHMKSMLQNWTNPPASWQDITVTYFTDKNLFVNNIKQGRIFHYVDKNFLTEAYIKDLENV